MYTIQRFTCLSQQLRQKISTQRQIQALFPHVANYTSKPPDLTHSSIKKVQVVAESQEKWLTIYRLPIARWAAAFNRLKVYQGAVTMFGIPATFMMEQAELVSAGSVATCAAVGVTGLITLTLGSLAVKDLIGFIYINQQRDKLKFAYIDFWGRRRDITLDINDLIPDGAQEKPTRLNFYQKIRLYSNQNLKFKLLHRYGIVNESEIFDGLFY